MSRSRPLSLLCALALPGLFATSALAGDANDLPPITKKKVEMVFVLDTTGSMSGLIDAAKQKIWFIANEALKAKQKPELRIGLVAYRDKGDAYVTQELPLTDDLDAVYQTLMGYQAGGGGDGPEHVNAALDHAINKMQWTDSKHVLKLVFLVGDAPPHMDYSDDVKHTVTSQNAIRRNIYINTIQCGGDPSTTTVWKQIALNSEGRYAAIAQDGGVVAKATPYDDELRRLGDELDDTRLVYGRAPAKEAKKASYRRTKGMVAASGSGVAADRAMVKAKKVSSKSEDLVTRVAEDGFASLDSVSHEELPDELVGKSKAEQEKILKTTQARRASLQAKIAEVSKKRDEWLAEDAKKGPADPESFDAEVVDMVHAAAETVGLEY